MQELLPKHEESLNIIYNVTNGWITCRNIHTNQNDPKVSMSKVWLCASKHKASLTSLKAFEVCSLRPLGGTPSLIMLALTGQALIFTVFCPSDITQSVGENKVTVTSCNYFVLVYVFICKYIFLNVDDIPWYSIISVLAIVDVDFYKSCNQNYTKNNGHNVNLKFSNEGNKFCSVFINMCSWIKFRLIVHVHDAVCKIVLIQMSQRLIFLCYHALFLLFFPQLHFSQRQHLRACGVFVSCWLKIYRFNDRIFFYFKLYQNLFPTIALTIVSFIV